MNVVPRMLSQRGITESTENYSCYIKNANACRVKFLSTFFLIRQNIPVISALKLEELFKFTQPKSIQKEIPLMLSQRGMRFLLF